MTEAQHRPPADPAPEATAIAGEPFDWRARAVDDLWDDLAVLGIHPGHTISVDVGDDTHVGDLDVAIVRGEPLLVLDDVRGSAIAVPWRAVRALRYHSGGDR